MSSHIKIIHRKISETIHWNNSYKIPYECNSMDYTYREEKKKFVEYESSIY